LRNHISEAVIKKGNPFNIPNLESERERVSNLFRNRGYYYYHSDLASYVADTLRERGKVQLRFVLSDSLEERTKKQWYIGNINVNLHKQFRDSLWNFQKHRYFIAHFYGKHTPLRTGFISRGLKLRSHQLYNADAEYQTNKYFQSTGLFSNSSLTFTPRDTSANCDTLDLNMDLLFDKPYDFYIETNGKGKTTGRMGPELVMGFTKRNAFRGGENLNMNLHGSYEWQTGHKNEGSTSSVNSYEYGGDVSLVMPRLLTPGTLLHDLSIGKRRHHHTSTSYIQMPTTTIKTSINILNRAGYFRRHVISGELTYDWMPTVQSHFSFTPISISYEYMNSQTAKFDSLLSNNPYLKISMRDQMVPKMSLTYTYSSKPSYLSPITWSTAISEAGNILSLGYMVAGRKWSDKNKEMFKNPYAQFLKIETDLVKYWRFSSHSSLVGHLDGGVAWAYGNATEIPYYEQFYVGGANSVRAFNIRSIGPGKFVPLNSRYSYIDQTGNVKFLANLEYRPRFFGNLYGALFLDAGNVWNLKDNDRQVGGKFEINSFFKQLAVGTGVGLRYDMGMFVIRLDWGVGLHVPYDTGKSGFYNILHFKDAQSFHLAVGYPF
jgi:outer membrane protein assembly factor BamA